MKRKLLSALLAFGMLFATFAFVPHSEIVSVTSVNAHAETYDIFNYTVQTDGTVAITGFINKSSIPVELNVPSQIDGKTVTSVSFPAVYVNTTTTSVSLPNTITTLGENAFVNMQAITSLTIPASVKTVGNYAFQYCKGLQSITFKGNPTSFGTALFSGCTSLKKVDIPNGVTSMGGSLFYNCTSLTNITIPASVTSIDSTAFNGCTALQSISVSSGNSNYSSFDGVLYNKNQTSMICSPNAKSSLTIPGTIKDISEEFRFQNSNLTKLVLQEGVTTIGSSAFAFCKNLTSVTLPSTLTTIGSYAFNTCTSLNSITVPSGVTSIGSKALGFYRTSPSGSDMKQSGFTIKGYSGSKTESWAKTNGVTFESLGPACVHSWSSWVVTKQPTCTTAGEETRTCSKCNETEKQPVAATGHSYGEPTYNWIKTSSGFNCAATAACTNNSSHTPLKKTVTATLVSSNPVTCTTDGEAVYSATVELGDRSYTVTHTVVTEAKGHSYGSPKWTWDGYTKATVKITCSTCKTEKTLTAKITSVTTEPTCTTSGKTVYTATAQFNGKTYTATKTETLASPGHSFGAPDSWEWTDYKAKAHFTCSVCKDKQTLSASVSSSITVSPTCTAAGEKVYTAKVTPKNSNISYTDTKTEILAAKAHTYGSPKWTWDGYTKATAEFTCSSCKGVAKVNAVVASEQTAAATCTATGKIKHTATIEFNGATKSTYVYETVDKLSHSYNEPAWTWTKTSSGYTCTAKFTCSRCNSTTSKAASVTASVTEAICTTDGKKTYTATVTVDGKTYTATKTDTVTATGHTYGEPTWTWSSDFSTATAKFTCTNGDSTKTVNATISKTTTAATCTAEGKTVYKASVSFNGKTYTNSQTEVLEAKGHSYGTPKWIWSGYGSAKAECTCTRCSDKLSVLAMIRLTKTEPTCTTAGKSVYTATATLGDNTYTDAKTETLAATGHSYGEPVWSWTGTSAATAKFTCEKGDSTVTRSATITTKTTQPTCTAEGKKTFTATVPFNNKTYTDIKTETIAKAEHKWGDWKVTTQPTETQTGIKTRVCSACGETMTETVPVTAHTHKYTSSVVKPTCTEQGYTVYTCACGDSYKANYTNAKGHSFGSWTTTKAATCTEDGVKSRTCSVCKHKETMSIASSGHSIEDKIVKPTCTAQGYTQHTCTKCGTVTKDSYTAATGHSFSNWTVTKEPDCTNDGSRSRTCSVCKKTETETVEKLGHNIVETIVPPTCTEQGYTLTTCSRCGKSEKSDYKSALNHSFGNWTTVTEATCTEKGEQTRKCSKCSLTETRETSALQHSWTTKVSAPTCTAQGYTTHTCSRCKESYKDSYTSASGHTWSSWKTTIKATESSEGTKQRTCSVCSAVEKQTIPKLGHSYKKVVTAPTCTAQGYTTYTCTDCQDSYKSDYVEALGHNFVLSKVVQPTCTAKGYTVYKCTRCTKTKKDTYIDAVGHKFGDWKVTKEPTCTAAGSKSRTCSVCKTTETEAIAKLGHSNVKTVIAPTCTEQGYTLTTCTRCGKSSKSNYTDPVSHSFGKWKTTTAATCTATGEKQRQCSKCQTVETAVIKAQGHDFTDSVVKATIVKPTCTEQGYTIHTCSRCGTTKNDTIVAAAGHKFGSYATTKAATCTEDGLQTRTCSVCKYTENKTLSMLGHSMTDEVIAASCTTTGCTIHKCTRAGCTHSYKDNETPKLSIRLSGKTRYDTSLAIADQLRAENGNKKFTCVIIANGKDYADALSASYLAKVKNAPIIITDTSVTQQIVDYVKSNALASAQIYIIGGKKAVSEDTESLLAASFKKVKRLSGKNRFITNISVLEEAGVTNQKLIVASGRDYADALSASAVGLPILLTEGNGLSAEQQEYLKTLKRRTAFVVGGGKAVSAGIETQLGELFKTVTRVKGSNRYETSVEIAKKFFKDQPTISLAYARNFPDGLCGGPLAMKYTCPLILTENGNISQAQSYAQSIYATNTVTFGGNKNISDESLALILS